MMLTDLTAVHQHDRKGDASYAHCRLLQTCLRTSASFILTLAMLPAGNILYAEELSKPGRYRVQTELGQWTDPGRNNRVIPFKIYAPVDSKGRLSQVLRGRLDPERIGVSGHSLGGITTQVIAGQDVKGYGQQFCLPKLKGAVILSPSPPRPRFGDSATAFKDMKMPMLSITGTADTPPDKSFPAKERRVPFDRTSNVDQWLLVLDGATHFTFSGNLERPRIAALLPGMEADPKLVENHEKIKAVTLAFWRLTLLDDPIAKDKLTIVLPIVVQSNGSLEYKPTTQQRPK